MFALVLLACQAPPPPVAAPMAHSWKDEAELVVAGLEEVKGLWDQGQKPAAKTAAENVYTDRFEPRIEPALREMEGPKETAKVEYGFAQLQLALDGKDRTVIEEQISDLERRTRSIGEAAERAFPPPGQAAAPPPPPKDVKPIVPDVPPAWEIDKAPAAEGEGGGSAAKPAPG